MKAFKIDHNDYGKGSVVVVADTFAEAESKFMRSHPYATPLTIYMIADEAYYVTKD